MEKVGFVGGYDKTDLIIYIAKILTEMGNKVIIIDTTQKQKTRYVVPAINPTVSYVTEFEKIDVAVGFKDFKSIKSYLGENDEEFNYDYALIDIDDMALLSQTALAITDKTYFVTAFDLYSLKKGVEILGDIKNPLKLTKIYFTKTFYNEEDEYLEFLALGKKVIWNETIIYFPVENGDETAIAENQRLGKVKFKNLSIDYKDGIANLASDISGEKARRIKDMFKYLK